MHTCIETYTYRNVFKRTKTINTMYTHTGFSLNWLHYFFTDSRCLLTMKTTLNARKKSMLFTRYVFLIKVMDVIWFWLVRIPTNAECIIFLIYWFYESLINPNPIQTRTLRNGPRRRSTTLPDVASSLVIAPLPSMLVRSGAWSPHSRNSLPLMTSCKRST